MPVPVKYSSSRKYWHHELIVNRTIHYTLYSLEGTTSFLGPMNPNK
jgi:hypothetical protein